MNDDDRRLLGGRLRERRRPRRSPWLRVIAYAVALALVIHVMYLLNERGSAMLTAIFGRLAGEEAKAPPSAPATEPVPMREIVVPASPSAAP